MKIDILTLFPEMFEGPFDESILKRAQKKKLVKIKVYNLRKWGLGKHKQVDDRPYGGGVGMVLRPEPVFKAVRELQKKFYKNHKRNEVSHVIFLTPSGRKYNFRIAKKLAALPHLILVCGRYEGEDSRIFEELVNERLSIGDYILTGGELAAMVIVDSVSRLVKGVLTREESVVGESLEYAGGILKYPQYTRPQEYEGLEVPEILVSGNHAAIAKWRKEKALERTRKYRPDLLEKKK